MKVRAVAIRPITLIVYGDFVQLFEGTSPGFTSSVKTPFRRCCFERAIRHRFVRPCMIIAGAVVEVDGEDGGLSHFLETNNRE